MASTNQTPSYKLSQWVETDPVLREDFNADNRKIESALFGLQSNINDNRVVVGEYTGTGSSVTQVINLGFRPRLVLVLTSGDVSGTSTYPAMTTTSSTGRSISITNNGFQVNVYQNLTDAQVTNINPYRYLAIR